MTIFLTTCMCMCFFFLFSLSGFAICLHSCKPTMVFDLCALSSNHLWENQSPNIYIYGGVVFVWNEPMEYNHLLAVVTMLCWLPRKCVPIEFPERIHRFPFYPSIPPIRATLHTLHFVNISDMCFDIARYTVSIVYYQ